MERDFKENKEISPLQLALDCPVSGQLLKAGLGQVSALYHEANYLDGLVITIILVF